MPESCSTKRWQQSERSASRPAKFRAAMPSRLPSGELACDKPVRSLYRWFNVIRAYRFPFSSTHQYLNKNKPPFFDRNARRHKCQIYSASGCERNWNIFEHIHSKRRNRLEHQKLNDLVYIRYNLRLQQMYYYIDYTLIVYLFCLDFFIVDIWAFWSI